MQNCLCYIFAHNETVKFTVFRELGKFLRISGVVLMMMEKKISLSGEETRREKERRREKRGKEKGLGAE